MSSNNDKQRAKETASRLAELEDSFGEFLAATCEVGEDFTEPAAGISGAWSDWVHSQVLPMRGAANFAVYLCKAVPGVSRTTVTDYFGRSVYCYRGIRLIDSPWRDREESLRISVARAIDGKTVFTTSDFLEMMAASGDVPSKGVAAAILRSLGYDCPARVLPDGSKCRVWEHASLRDRWSVAIASIPGDGKLSLQEIALAAGLEYTALSAGEKATLGRVATSMGYAKCLKTVGGKRVPAIRPPKRVA